MAHGKATQAAEHHGQRKVAEYNEQALAAAVYGRVGVKMAGPAWVVAARQVHDEVLRPAHTAARICAVLM